MSPLGGEPRKLWRIAATGLCFAAFGIGAVVLGLTVSPLLRMSSLDRGTGLRRVRLATSFAMRTAIYTMRGLGLLTFDIRHAERLRAGGQLVVANHPTLIDVVFLIGFIPGVDCIVKDSLWRNPFLRWPVACAGYLSNSGRPGAAGESLVAECAAALAAGRSLVIFPEGTRTVPGAVPELRRGAAQIALAAGVDLRPVTITCTPPTLFKNNPWYRVPERTPHWQLDVGEPIRIAGFQDGASTTARAARRLTQAIALHFGAHVAVETGARSQSSLSSLI